MYNISFIHVCCISWTYLHKKQMSKLPFMTVRIIEIGPHLPKLS